MTVGRPTARAFAKRDPHICNSGPIILGKIPTTSCSSESRPSFLQSHTREIPCRRTNRRQCTSILSYLKRWITEIWYGIIRRLKSIFSKRFDRDKISSDLGKVPSEMNSELENTFWREGIQKLDKMRGAFVPRTSACWDHRYIGLGGLGDHGDMYFPYMKRNLESGSQETRQSSDCHSDCEFRKQFGSFPASLDSPQSFDEEYNALYETKTLPARSLSDSGRPSSKESGKFGSLKGDCFSSVTKSKKENRGGHVNCGSDGSESRQKVFSSCESENSTMENREATTDGEWVETDLSESVWYSKSELNAALAERKSTARRIRPSSRIPRLCSKSQKSLPKRY